MIVITAVIGGRLFSLPLQPLEVARGKHGNSTAEQQLAYDSKNFAAALAIIFAAGRGTGSQGVDNLCGWEGNSTFLLSVPRAVDVYINRGMSEKQTTTSPKCLTET